MDRILPPVREDNPHTSRVSDALPLTTIACYDGAIHLWSASSNFVRPNMSMETAHGKSTETGSVALSLDGRTLLTRGGDDTVKSAYRIPKIFSELTRH